MRSSALDLLAELRQRLLDRARRLVEQRRVGSGDVAERQQLGDRLDPELLGLRPRHHDDGRAAVGDLRGVAGGDAAVAVEGGPQTGEGLDRGAGPDPLVSFDDDRVALALGDLDRLDLGEAPFLRRVRGAFVALRREVVHGVARDATVRLCRPLRALAHVDVLEAAHQTVGEHRVEQRAVAHPVSGPRVLQEIRRAGHRLHARGDHDVGVAGLDHEVGEVDGIDARETRLVEPDRRDVERDPGLHRGLARRHLARARLDHLADVHVVDLVGAHPAPGERGLDRVAAEVGGAQRRQRPRETTDGGASGRDDHGARHGEPPTEEPESENGKLPDGSFAPRGGSGRGAGNGRGRRDPRRDPRGRARRRPRCPPAARFVSGCGGAGRRAGDVRGRAVGGEGSPQVPAHRRRAAPRAGTRRGAGRGDGVVGELQHRVDVDLRADPHLRLPGAARTRERVGCASRSTVPRGRERCRRCGVARGFGGAFVEARRRGHGALQPRRRPGPERARRLDAGDEPAHLGLRDELRRSR